MVVMLSDLVENGRVGHNLTIGDTELLLYGHINFSTIDFATLGAVPVVICNCMKLRGQHGGT